MIGGASVGDTVDTIAHGASLAVMPVTLRTHADLANALRTLGLGADDIKDGAKDIKPKKTSDKELARAVKDALKELDKKELKELRRTLGDTAAPPAPASTSNGASQVTARLPVAKNGKEPKLDANLPAVAALLDRYGVTGPVPRPLERVLVHVAKVHDLLDGEPNVDKLLDRAMAADVRRHVFLLEGVSKVYERRYDDAADVNVSAKGLEDALGGLSATRTNLAYAQQVKAPADVIALLEKAERDAKAALKKTLAEQWMPDAKGRIPALTAILEGWGEAKWDDYADDKKYLRGELHRRLVKLSDTTFDMNELETGIHELRRQLRWFPIYTESVNGLLQLDATKNPVAAYEPLLGVKLATSKYVDLPDDAREVDAIRISKSLYLALMQLTLDLGGIKDAGEPVEALFHAYQSTGRAATLDDAKKQVFALIGSDKIAHDVHDNAKRLYAEMKANKLVEKLAEQVKKG